MSKTYDIIIAILIGFYHNLNNCEWRSGFCRSRKAHLLAPQKWDKLTLVKMAYLNAESTFKKEKDADTPMENTLTEMEERFSLKRYPEHVA